MPCKEQIMDDLQGWIPSRSMLGIASGRCISGEYEDDSKSEKMLRDRVLSEIKEKGIIVPDLCNSVNEIDMLLGTDVINVILSGRTIKLMSGLIAIGTMLGFTLMGLTFKKWSRKFPLEEYASIFDEWEALKIIEKVPETEFETDAYYLPHTAVSKISETTKIRPIFNATSREGNNPSLYDCLLSGPNLIELIPDILDRFRMYCIGLSADIEKAFLQISVTPEHRDFLRFFLSS
ncbi:integrase catalytic domain-containing protein [Trichonephila inaurata madagascariensis]|uniref:Integrase catalytic domain-containing protein n=1 Tax=Trichonephila inaurata madagascariensis TaxID=2747483 RepID=A0A8X6ME15_9ARAC|nr:integrase catalytic domain-containing protein [Trichonephila inaurata madagascariensis]